MSVSYDTLGFSLTVNAAGSQITVGTDDTLVLVGGYDSANADGSVTAGEAITVEDPTNAEDQFGTSELSRACEVAASNRSGQQVAVPVPETQTTESFAASSAGTLSNDPIFDPRLHPDESTTVTDTSAGTDLAVQYVDVDPGTVSLGTDEAAINPVTGTWATDASSDYDITYTYGDYDTAISEAVTVSDARYVYVGTENDSVKATLQTELANVATDFRFLRGIVGADPNIDPTSTGNYTPSTDDWRMIEVAPTRATMADGAVRTGAAVAGLMTIQPVDVSGSVTYDTVSGLTGYATEYRPSQAESFERVTAVADDDTITQAATTSSTDQFSNVYAVEIVDLVALGIKDIVDDYKGGSNEVSARRGMATDMRQLLDGYWKATPSLLSTGDGGRPYLVSQSLGASDSTTEVNVGIDPAPIMEQVNLNLNVGDVVTFGGVS